MKKVFLDANILIDFFDSKRPHNADAVELVHYLLTHKIQIVFSEDMISTIIFILQKQNAYIDDILAHIYEITYDLQVKICSFGGEVIRKACEHYLQYKGDFEDYLQYFCAEKEKCVAIYSMDKDFPQLQIPIKHYGEFDI